VRNKTMFFLLAVLLTAIPAGSQYGNVFFSLNTNKTFLPGEKINLHLYANGVDALEFRVYKVNNPVRFFEKLDNVHNFGQFAQKEQVETRTFLERFHDWKRELWLGIRNFFRHQYSSEVREKIREERGTAQKSKELEATVFAQTPILNSQQLVARWQQKMPPHYYAQTEEVPVADLAKGVYLVEATNGQLRAYTAVIVTEIGLVTKTAQGQMVTFVADRRSGAPVDKANILLWSDKKELTQLNSGADGLAEATLPKEKHEDVRALATHGDDVAVVSPSAYNLSTNPDEDWTGYVYTDRPVYRPGHTVHFKVILRTRSGERYAVPAGQSVQIVIEDPSSKQLYQTNLPVSSFGTVHGELNLAENAALGYYSISVNTGGQRHYNMSGGFHVEEYKKPEYEVKVTPSQARVLQGESITAIVEAKYYFGEPVAGAAVKWVVHTSQYWSPFIERDEDDAADNGGNGEVEEGEGGGTSDRYFAGEQISEESGTLGADGKLLIHVPTQLNAKHRDVRYRIEARVTDAGNREISGANSVIVTYGTFQVGISADSYVYQKDETINATAVAKDYDGHPIQTAIHAELVRWHWYGYGNTARSQEDVIESQNVHTQSDGSARVTFLAEEAGSFHLRVTAETPEKREVNQVSWIWISGAGENWWGGGQERQIRMVADKKSYKVGDRARVLVMTGVPEAYLLITTEGRTVQSKKVVHATAPTVTVELPIQSSNQPNVFVSAVFLHDDKLYQASKSLNVPAVQQKLQIDIQPSKKQFQPGDKATYTLVARDASGKPVQGELSVGIVDEALYAVRPESTPDIHDFFYGPVYDRVGTESSLNFYFSGHAGKREMFLTKYSAFGNGRALAQLKPSDTMVEPKVRKVFPDTALWLAEVRTDARGRAVAELTFPDSLTTWRATVRGITTDTRVGSTIERVIVRKNLMVRLAVPRFFRQGDEVTVSAIVHNYLATTKSVRVSLDLKGLDVLEGSARALDVPSKGEAKLDWRVKAKSTNEAVLLAKALTNEESDAMELTLPIIPFGVKLHDAKSGSLSGPNQQEDSFVILPGNPEQAAPTLDITLSPSIAGGIFGGLDYLTHYPYGCTEQTMSSFLPNIIVAKAMKDLHLTTTVNTPELEKKIQAGIERLKGFQHADGGWGWWKEDESVVFMTAYVVSGFGQAHAAGYDYDPASLARAEEWLRKSLDNNPNMRPDLRAYVVYALALNSSSKPEYVQKAWDARDSMSTQGLSMLGLALQATGDDARAKEIAGKVETMATVNDLEANWSATYDYFMEFESESGAEATAHAVRLLSLTKPESPLLPKAAFWLVNHRNGGYYWDSTKQTAMVIFGLTEYVKASHELEANFKAEVYVNGKLVLARPFAAADGFNPVQPEVHLNTSQLLPGKNEIRIHKAGTGRLYWAATGTYYSTEKHLIQNGRYSLNITRDYYRMVADSTGGKIIYNLQPLSGELHVGDVVAVRVTVGGNEWRYLLVEDPIPAGAEFVERDDLYEFRQKPAWWEYWWTRREFHDDRAAFFQTYFTRNHEYVYLLKIVNPGKFQVSPAIVQPMYQPSLLATSDAATIEVK
jgi:alpha-2-macroglobulin